MGGRDRYRRRFDGNYKFLVKTPGDLKMLMMYNDCFVAEFAHALGSKKRPRALKFANQLGLKVINGHAKMQTRGGLSITVTITISILIWNTLLLMDCDSMSCFGWIYVLKCIVKRKMSHLVLDLTQFDVT